MLMHFSLCQLEDKLNVKREVMSVPARLMEVVPVMGEEAQRKLNSEKTIELNDCGRGIIGSDAMNWATLPYNLATLLSTP
jgi:hypothetical protein